MILIAGLGNPGEKYENTRHNIGFKAIDEIISEFNLPLLDFKPNLSAGVSKGEINKEKIIIAKPNSFMNLSGNSISKIIRFYRVPLNKIIIIHDDIDIVLGKIKIITNRGSGGHKGIESIIKNIGNKNFIRIRIGNSPEKKPLNTEVFVLKKFKEEELKIINKSLKKTNEAIILIIKEGVEKANSLLNN